MNGITSTITNRVTIMKGGDHWDLLVLASSPGRARFRECWIREFEPVMIVACTDVGDFWVPPEALLLHGRRREDAWGPYWSLPARYWEPVFPAGGGGGR